MMMYCDLHNQSVDRRGCPWCRIEEIEGILNNVIEKESYWRNKYMAATGCKEITPPTLAELSLNRLERFVMMRSSHGGNHVETAKKL